MDAWLKTHVAKILPTGGALFYAGGQVEQLATNREALQLMVRGMREGLEVLRANDIPITPSNHRVREAEMAFNSTARDCDFYSAAYANQRGYA